jgi:hypothetical protein
MKVAYDLKVNGMMYHIFLMMNIMINYLVYVHIL